VSPSEKKPDPLQDLLAESETELTRRLQEACEAEERGVPSESTEQIRRLEDALLAAAMAAQQTINVRRHIQRREEADGQSAKTEPTPQHDTDSDEKASKDDTAPDQSGSADRPGGSVTGLREFTDSTGRSWRAWPVTPGLERRTGSDRQFLGDFQDGWICFESLDSTIRRRLPYREPAWAQLNPSELERLLERAIDAPGRKQRAPGPGRVSQT
jgi:hypothetical protein